VATCFGAKTVTLGSEELGLVCDIAAPVRLHSNAVERMATVADAIRLDDILITRSPKPDATAVASPNSREASLEASDVSREFRACVGFAIFHVGAAGRYTTVQTGYRFVCRLLRRPSCFWAHAAGFHQVGIEERLADLGVGL
jgi:hypothetical protein